MKFKKSSLALAVLLCISPVAFEPSYVYAQTVSQAQEDSNRGDVFKAQLASAQEGDTIILTGNTHLKRGQGFFEINKKVTIVGNGHTLHLEGYNLSLGADVTFQNVRLSLKPSESLDSIFSGGFNQQSDKPSIIFTNGNKLVLDNVDTTVEGASPNTRPIIVLGSKDANTTNAGHGELLVTNSGYKTKLHSIWAGGNSEQDEEQKTKITLEEGVSFVDPSVRGGNKAGIITGLFGNTSYTGELDITLASTDPSLKTFDTENNTNISLTLKSNVFGDGALDLGSVPTLKNLTLETRTPVNVESLNVTDTLTLKNGATLQTSPSSNTQSGISVNKINAENGTIKVGDNARLDITGTINEGSNLTVVGQNVNFPENSSYTRNEQGKVVTNPSSTDPNTNPPSNNGADATDNSTPTNDTNGTDNTSNSTPTGNTNEAGNTNTTEDVAGNNGNSTPDNNNNTDNNNSTTNVDNTTTDTGSDAGTGTPPNTATPDAPSTGSTPTNTTDSSPTPDSTAGTPDTTNSTPDTTDSSGSKPTESTPTNTPTNENSGDVNNSGGTNNTDDANNANGTAGGDSSATNNPPSNNNPTTGNDPANGNNTDTGSASSGTGNTPTKTATDTPPTDSGSTGTGTGTGTNNTDTEGATNSTSPSTPTGENNGSVSNTTDTTNGNPTPDNNPASGSNTDTGPATSDSGNASTDATTNTQPADSGSTGTATTTNNTDTEGATNSTSPSTPTGENNGSVSNTTDTAATDTTTPTSTGTTTTDATTPAVAPVSSASNLPQDVANLLPLARANYTAIVPHFAFDSIRTRLTYSRIGLQEDSLTASASGMAPALSTQDNLWVNSKYQRINRYNEHKLRHFGLQIGYDKAFALEYGLLRLGTAIDFQKGENSFADIADKLSSRSYGLSLYGSYETETQQYFDLIVRAAKTSSKLDQITKEKYRNSQYSVGIGYGKWIDLSTNWQIEPMLQLNYAHITSTSYMYNGIKVKSKSIDSLIGTLGIQAGFNLSPNTLIYGKAMVHREFAGQQKLDVLHSSVLNAQYSINNKATWGTLGFGVKAKWSKNTSMYFDANKVVGSGYRNSYQINLGLQWLF